MDKVFVDAKKAIDKDMYIEYKRFQTNYWDRNILHNDILIQIRRMNLFTISNKTPMTVFFFHTMLKPWIQGQ